MPGKTKTRAREVPFLPLSRAQLQRLETAAATILDRVGPFESRLHPLLAARAAGLSLRASEGLALPAQLDGTT
jgi:hypothetical protein